MFACSNQKPNEEKENAVNQAFLQNVQTAKAVLSSPESELTLAGKVGYDPDRVVRYVPLVSGVVEHTCFSLGDKVQRGQALLDLRSSELSALQSETVAAESELEIAQRTLQQAQTLFDDRMLSEKELLEAKAAVRQAQAAIARTKSDMSLYRQKGGGVFSIISPASGYIVEKNASSGSPAPQDGNPLFVIADLSRVWIIANVYAGDLQFVKEGMPVKISSLSYPNETFSGKIDVLSQVFDPEEKVLKARIVMPNIDLKFKPEMSVVIHLNNTKTVQQIAVPSNALIFDNDQYFVVVGKSQGNFEIRRVELAEHNDHTSYIRAGLNEGENVVINGQLLIYEELNGK